MYRKFESLLDSKGVRVAQVSRETGIDKTTFSKWKNGAYTPKADKLQKIADYFGVGLSYFYGEEKETVLSTAEKSLLSTFNELNAEGQELLLERASELLKLGYIKSNKAGMVGA